MKITHKGDYAIKAILDLSLHYNKPQSIEEISKRQDIPYKFLEQILLALKKGRFVRSIRGRYGGYILAREPKKIILGEVVRYIEGPVEPISCIYERGKTRCDFYCQCVFKDIFSDIGRYTAKKLDSEDFEGIKEKYKKRIAETKKVIDYSI